MQNRNKEILKKIKKKFCIQHVRGDSNANSNDLKELISKPVDER